MAILKSLSSGKFTQKAGAAPAASSGAAGMKLPGNLLLIVLGVLIRHPDFLTVGI
jgi:hypothetical protein